MSILLKRLFKRKKAWGNFLKVLGVAIGWFFYSSPLIALQVDVYEVGQGNCVAIKHNGKVLLIDAGSNESTFQGLYSQVSENKAKGFLLSSEGGANNPIQEGGGASMDTSADAGQRAMPTAGAASAPGVDVPSSPESVTSDVPYGGESGESPEPVIEQIHRFIGGEDVSNIVIVASHSDSDHVNLLPTLFPPEAPLTKKVSAMILGGFQREYSEDLAPLIETVGLQTGNVVFTGSYNGGAEYPQSESTLWDLVDHVEARFARPFCSFMEPKTPTEARIEELLSFPRGGGDPVSVQVLAMNAGHSFMSSGGKNVVTQINKETNANSLVLRIKGGKSFVIPGDADYTTWNFIEASKALFNLSPDDLHADYFLLSHHGSGEKGATRPSVLTLFNPNVLILSTGRHKRYGHPARATIEMAINHLKKKTDRTGLHYVTYFKERTASRPRSHQRLYHGYPLFSTLNNGTISFDLDAPIPGGALPAAAALEQTLKVTCSRDRSPFFQKGPGDLFMPVAQFVFQDKQEIIPFVKQLQGDSGAGMRFWTEKDVGLKTEKGVYTITEDPDLPELKPTQVEGGGEPEVKNYVIREKRNQTAKTDKTAKREKRESAYILYEVEETELPDPSDSLSQENNDPSSQDDEP